MRLKITLLLLGGSILALGAGATSFSYLTAAAQEVREVRHALTSYGTLAEVAVLKEAKPAGTELTALDFETLRIPEQYLAQGIVRALPEVAEGQALVSTEPLAAGVLISDSALGLRNTDQDEGAAHQLTLLSGHQALAVRADNFAQMARILEVGRTVDLFWTTELNGKSETRLLLSGAKILALPEAAPEQMRVAGQAGDLTLSLEPQDIARVLQAAQAGRLNITLSNGARPLEDGAVVVSTVELTNLPLALRAGGALQQGPDGGMVYITGQNPAPPLAAEPPSLAQFLAGDPDQKTCTTAIVRAGQRVSVEVPC